MVKLVKLVTRVVRCALEEFCFVIDSKVVLCYVQFAGNIILIL
jgi:hypothetical protein